VARLGLGVNSSEVGKCHMVRLEISPLRVDPSGDYVSPSSRPSHDLKTCVPGPSKLGCGCGLKGVALCCRSQGHGGRVDQSPFGEV